MTTKEKMQILIDGGKLRNKLWGKDAYVYLHKDGVLRWWDSSIASMNDLITCDQIYIEPEDNQLYEWAYKDSDGDFVCSGIFKTKKEAKEHYTDYSEYYLLRKFEPMETFKNEN